jgi:AcrR family transcriptional regulator
VRTSNHSARERILATATDLFSREGYRAVGTDTIIERSGVAKMTLYRHFAAKNELICAYIEQTIEKFWASVERVVSEHPDAPREQLVKIFEMLAVDVADPTFCGCSCLHAAVEFPEPDHPAHKLASQHKQDVRARFRDLAQQAGARQPEVLADQLLMLMNGLLMQGRMQGPTDMSLPVVQAAKALIDVQLTK